MVVNLSELWSVSCWNASVGENVLSVIFSSTWQFVSM